MSSHVSNVRPKPYKVLSLIADYARDHQIKSPEAYATARYCLMEDRKSTRLNSSHIQKSRMPSSA